MADLLSKNLRTPDETVRFPGLALELVDLGDVTVSHVVLDPGWRWSTHVRPTVGGQSCQARHVGIVLSGRFGVSLDDGRALEFGPDDVFDIPPGHDGWTIGEEPCVQLEWFGLRTFAGPRVGMHGRMLATLLFTDLVGSTALAERLGDTAWRALLSAHFEAVRAELDRHGGREVKTTGDGLFATFAGPAPALHCAAGIRRLAAREGIHVRAGVHVGEVELVGNDVRGVAVHEAARIAALAGEDEILVSEITQTLAVASGPSLRGSRSPRAQGTRGQAAAARLRRRRRDGLTQVNRR